MTATNSNQARPLRRTRDNRILGGVSSAIAERFDVGINTIRIAFVVLALLGGGGALLYAAGWLLIPDESAEASIAEDFVSGLGWH